MILEKRKTHKWINGKCIYCKTEKIRIENPNANWDWTQYVDPETGDITQKKQCHSNQTELNL